jgi:hypothetical protein
MEFTGEMVDVQDARCHRKIGGIGAETRNTKLVLMTGTSIP